MSNAATAIVGKIVEKIAGTALHAFVFSVVSTKVSEFMKKKEEEAKKDDEHIRIKPISSTEPAIDTDKI